MFKSTVRPLLCAFLVACVAGAAFTACDKKAGEGAQAAQRQGPPPNAPYITVQSGTIQISDTYPGRVVAIRTAEVRPQVSGIVRSRLFTEGSIVEKGDPLYQIDPDIFKANVAAAKASLASADAKKKLAEQDFKRAKQLHASGIATDQQLDTASANLDLAKAAILSAKAQLRRSRLDLGWAKVRAPLSGRISISKITEGALVSPQDPQPMTVIQEVDKVYVDVREPIESFQKMQRMIASGGLKPLDTREVAILSPRGMPYPVKGKFMFTDTAVDPTTSEVTIRTLVDNTDMVLRPGMFVRAQLSQGVLHHAVTVPQQAVKHDPVIGAYVDVIDDDQTIQRTNVKTERIIDGKYLITDGLTDGVRVVTEGQSKMRPGMKVTPVEWQAASVGGEMPPGMRADGSQPSKTKSTDEPPDAKAEGNAEEDEAADAKPSTDAAADTDSSDDEPIR